MVIQWIFRHRFARSAPPDRAARLKLFSSWIRFITFPRRIWFFVELATFSLSFWSSVQAKRASESIFFLLFLFGAQTDTEINPLY